MLKKNMKKIAVPATKERNPRDRRDKASSKQQPGYKARLNKRNGAKYYYTLEFLAIFMYNHLICYK